MRRPADFEQAVRRGARGGRDTVVVHLTQRTDPGPGPVVGFVVSKGVGNAVTRNLVKRRLRALVHARLSGVPSSASLVVRALPASATASFGSLEQDLDGALATAQRRLARSVSS
jgi:ribonuclease P protein component